jgi:hypothetical protein
MHRRIEECRISDSRNLVSVLNLGEQSFTGNISWFWGLCFFEK